MLIESQIYHALENIPRSHTALTSARAAANAIHIDTSIRAALDLQTGKVFNVLYEKCFLK